MKTKIVGIITTLTVFFSATIPNTNSHSQSTQKPKDTVLSAPIGKLRIEPLVLDTLVSKLDTIRSTQNATKTILDNSNSISKNNFVKARNIKNYLKDSIDVIKPDTVLYVKKVLVVEKIDTVYNETKVPFNSPVKKEEKNLFQKIFKIFPQKRK